MTLELGDCRLDGFMDRCEKLLLKHALRETRGNQSKTARLLGITPRSVYNKLRKHQLST
jgi:DNA-binding NtrC family response regulator